MKWIYLILSLYVVSLSVIPCADEFSSLYENAVSNDETHSHEENCSDQCSPFCSCACCGVSINYYASVSLDAAPNKLSVSKLKLLISHHAQSGFSGSVWQPPKSEV